MNVQGKMVLVYSRSLVIVTSMAMGRLAEKNSK
jgi:hypothetical protein